ncbi:carboxynorspermidine decarboxylase [Pseudobutyrivibrio sp.]|uniref:carboxynorspermidine decarboxylase n=1 Tax=Pseudobutyrivibrio sp. TaxID=2014367 RepID=UPI00386B2965
MFISKVETPSYVIDEGKLIENLRVLDRVQTEAGCKILLAQKAFSNFAVYPLIGKYLAGTTASGIYEARLGKEEMGKENHVFAPAYKDEDMAELVQICDHIIFNSVAQLMKYKNMCLDNGVEIGLRVNPEMSTQKDHAIYDPCAKGSRLGVTAAKLKEALEADSTFLDGVTGLHFHTLCEQNSDDLETTLAAFEEKFGDYLPQMKWLNMGGGHHISRADYDVAKLISLIKHVKTTYDLQVYLEPGEAIALDAGYFVTEVLDIVDNDIKTLILDGSAACHMPDVLEMPYRPPLMDSGQWGEKPFEYRLSSYTCLAGDIIGDYSFDHEIKVGDRLVFEDMAIYSMVKNNTFNGIPLPSIYLLKADGSLELIKKFGYEDFKNRLS